MARGRPSTYTPEIADRICAELAEGKSLVKICGKSGMPNCATVFRWLTVTPEFRENYTRAREAQADYYAAEIADIADTCRQGHKVEKKEIGRACSKCGKSVRWQAEWRHMNDSTTLCEGAKAETVYETKTVTGDMVERSRLMVDARKWLASKLAPKKYGERIEHAGDPNAPLLPHIVVEFVDSPKGKTE